LPKELVVRSQRERLLSSILEVVAEKGYPETTVADVIDRAGVSRATFYQLFTDKEECFLVMYRELTELTVSYVQRAYDSAATWPEQIEAGLAALLRFLSANAAIAKVAIIDALAAGEQARMHYREAVRAFVPFVEGGRAVSDSSLPIPPTVPLVVVGGIMHTVFEHVAGGRSDDLPRLLPDLVFMTTAPYVGPEQALDLKLNAERTRHGLDA
jgi:AcrR family transcriptional regulator